MHSEQPGRQQPFSGIGLSGKNIFTGHLISLYSWPQTGWQPVKRWSNWNLGNRNLPRKLHLPNHKVGQDLHSPLFIYLDCVTVWAFFVDNLICLRVCFIPIEASLPRSHPEKGRLCILPADQPVWCGHGHNEEEGGDQSGPAGGLDAGRPGHQLPLWCSCQAAEQTHLTILNLLSITLGQHPRIPR